MSNSKIGSYMLWLSISLISVDILRGIELFTLFSFMCVLLVVLTAIFYLDLKKLTNITLVFSIYFMLFRYFEYITISKRIASWIFIFLLIEMAYLILKRDKDADNK